MRSEADQNTAVPAPAWQRAAGLPSGIAPSIWDDPDGVIARDGVVLKRGAYHRTTAVVRAEDGDAAVLVKRFHLRDLRERLLWRLRRAAPQREWRILMRLTARAVSVPQPLALGMRRVAGGIDVWLMVAYINRACTFDTVHPPRDPRLLARGARSLARAIAAVHAADVVHGDLHSGNLLYQSEHDAWFITDFQRAHIGLPSRDALVRDLVQLQHCLGKKVPLGARLLFLRVYLREFARLTDTQVSTTADAWRWLFAEVRRSYREYAIAQAERRSHRCWRSNRDVAPLAAWMPTDKLPAGIERGWAARSLSRRLVGDLAQLCAAPTWYLASDVTLLRNTRAKICGVIAHPQRHVFVTYVPAPASRLQRWLRRGRMRVWRTLWRARHLHLCVPQPLLHIRARHGFFIVLRYYPHVLAAATALPGATPQLRTRLVRALARAVGYLHDRGVRHGSLTAQHVHVDTSNPALPRILLTGYDHMRFHTRLPWRARVHDLAHLYHAGAMPVSQAERRMFLRHYLRMQSRPINQRQLILDVLEQVRT